MIIIGPYSWSGLGQLRSGTRDWRQHQTACDVAGCRYHWRLLSAVMTVPLHLSLIVLPRRSCPNFYHYCILQHAGTTQGECKIHRNQLVLKAYLIPTDIYATVAAGTAGGGAEEFLLRPQRTPRHSPSMSSPFAHASAARSADIRSLKLTNAHLRHRHRSGKLRTHNAQRVNHLDFATWTIERKDVGSTPGNDLMTRVRMVCSVADAGKEERNNDIWSQMRAGT